MSGTVIVPPSPTPVFDGLQGTAFEFTLTTDAAASFRNFQPGTLYSFDIAQDATGGHIFTWPASVSNAGEINPAPASRTTQVLIPRRDGRQYAVTIATTIEV